MNVLDKAEDLAAYTIKLTDNTNYFPKKRRFTFSDRMQNLALDICDYLIQTNDTPKEEVETRREYQRAALSCVKRLKFFVRLSCDLEFINARQLGVWGKKLVDVQNMTASWYKKTQYVEQKNEQCPDCNLTKKE